MEAIAYWDCITSSEHLNSWAVDIRRAITSAARNHQWDELLRALMTSSGKGWVNSVHLDELILNAPLHEAARGGAPQDVVQEIVSLLAFRAQRNAQGQRPIDIAHDAGHTHLYNILEPTLRSDIKSADLQSIQYHFHNLIFQRGVHLKNSTYQSLRLPELEPLLETNIGEIWCTIPGMYGGFTYWLKPESAIPTLVTRSHIRIVGNSEERHEIDVNGIRPVQMAGRSFK